MSRNHFNKYLQSLTEEEKTAELKMLHTKFKEVKKYYALELGSQEDRQKLYTKSKKAISNLYLIRGIHRKRPRIQKLNKLLSDLKKDAIFPHELIDVYLHSVKHACQFFKDKRKSPDATVNHSVKSFMTALDLIEDAQMQDQYQERCNEIIQLPPSWMAVSAVLEDALEARNWS